MIHFLSFYSFVERIGMMVNFPNCKINLGLSVIRKRADGFHDIESVFYPVGLQDALEIIEAPDNTFRIIVTGFQIDSQPKQNLCVKAFELLRKTYDIPPVHMHLHKAIPMEAGLGGGSADCAFTIRLLNELFALNLSSEEMQKDVAQLGSDCPFFICNKTALVTGRGDEFRPVDLTLDQYYIVIVKPKVSISTGMAYSRIKPCIKKTTIWDIIHKPISDWKDLLVNDFEEPVLKMFPQLGEIKKKLYDKGAIYASMSGSGSAIYGIFDHGVNLLKCFPYCFYWSGKA